MEPPSTICGEFRVWYNPFGSRAPNGIHNGPEWEKRAASSHLLCMFITGSRGFGQRSEMHFVIASSEDRASPEPQCHFSPHQSQFVRASGVYSSPTRQHGESHCAKAAPESHKAALSVEDSEPDRHTLPARVPLAHLSPDMWLVHRQGQDLRLP